ncbi:hypothetical protein B0H13DRAFT_1912888 [Mycena leptocephala]|nr:hypothetical protein B0H13DRAFT_1912888 [Mycena leptocephala]
MSTFQIHCEHPGSESILGRTFDKVMPGTGEARKCDDLTDLSPFIALIARRPVAHISPGLAIICTTPTKLPPYFHGCSRPPELFTVVHDCRGIHLVIKNHDVAIALVWGTTLRGRPQDTLSFSTTNGAGVDAETTAPRSQCNSAPYLKIPSCILYRVKKSSGRRSGRQGGRWWPKTVKFAIWRLAVNLAGNVAAMADKPHIGRLAASRQQA